MNPLDAFDHGFMQRALWASLLAGANCALVGAYIVLRRMAFIGGALSHTLLPGVILAYWLHWPLFWGGLLAGLATAGGVGALVQRHKVYEDTAIGIVLSSLFALGILMVSCTQSFKNFESLLIGNVLGVSSADLIFTLKISCVLLLTLFLFHKELELSSFDAEYATFIGTRPKALNYLLLCLVALSVVSSLSVTGTLLANAFLIIPAATARLLSDRLCVILALCVLFSSLSSFIGLVLSYTYNVSCGAAIVLVCSGFFMLAKLWSWSKG